MSKLKKIELTIQEIWDACNPKIQKNKKKYNRKTKHKKKENE